MCRASPVFLMALVACPLFAEQRLSWDLSTSVSMMLGRATELVYTYPGGERYKLSELDWALEPLVLTGLDLRMKTANGFFATLNLAGALPQVTGLIQDYDYLNGDGRITHFSEHTCQGLGAVTGAVAVGWDFSLAPWLTLKPFMSFTMLYFKWAADNGYLQYPPQTSYPYDYWSSSVFKVPFYGRGITYEQFHYYPSIGLDAEVLFSTEFKIVLGVSFAPWTWCDDRDEHLARNITFIERMSGGIAWEPRIELSYSSGPKLAILAACSYRSIAGLVGDAYVNENAGAGWFRYPDGGGASFQAFECSLGLSWKF